MKILRDRGAAGGLLVACLPFGGALATFVPDPHKIVWSPGLIVVMYEADGTHRQTYTDGRGLPKQIVQPAWTGYSAGKRDGDTLIVETAGFNNRTSLDAIGHPHSEALRVGESSAAATSVTIDRKDDANQAATPTLCYLGRPCAAWPVPARPNGTASGTNRPPTARP